MGKVSRTEGNLFPWPKGAFVVNGRYLYVNTSNKYVSLSERNSKGTRGYTSHDQSCIGVLKEPGNRECKFFYANKYFRDNYLTPESVELPEPPRVADSVSTGLHYIISKSAEASALTEILAEVFGSEDARQILDLANYMISRESAVMQHYPSWARDHILFSENIQNDTWLGRFLRERISIPKINSFKMKWAVLNIGNGAVYLCYDSTNVNSQANGVFIVQKGHAKDDPTIPQVNSDYVIRQMDGLPITYMHSPGSVTDIAQAQEMIQFFRKISEKAKIALNIVLICDRGYISEKNLRKMDSAEIGYLLMLRANFGLHESLSEQYVDDIQSYQNILATPNGDEKYGLTQECILYENGKPCYAHIIWSEELYRGKRDDVDRKINTARDSLTTFIELSKEKEFTEEELHKAIGDYRRKLFNLNLIAGTPHQVQVKVGRGRGVHIEVRDVATYKVTGFNDNVNSINRERKKCGLYILISSEKMTAQQAIDAYAKRDCVEKMFEALKSHMGMDKIGVNSEEAIHGKGFIWFVASILHALLFNRTERLRVSDRKHYTVPAMVDELEAIKADKDLDTGKYKRRYKLTKRQSAILGCWETDETGVDDCINAQLNG